MGAATFLIFETGSASLESRSEDLRELRYSISCVFVIHIANKAEFMWG